MTKRIKIVLRIVALPLAVLATPVLAQIAVFDSGNYAQNMVQAARALEQINNQLRSLQNQTAMLETMARNLKTVDFPELLKIGSALQQIDQLMAKAQGIEFNVNTLDQRYRALFPGTSDSVLTTDQRVAAAKSRFETAMESFRHSMSIEADIVSSVHDDAMQLQALATRSEGAVGSLQAEQAGNQLLALSTKQQMQLQELLAAEFRSEAIERASQLQTEEEGRQATQHFLGSGKAYTSPHK